MKKIVSVVFIIIAFVASSVAADNTANKTVERYRKAAGGGQLKRVKSTVIVGSIKTADGATGRFYHRAMMPESFRADVEINGAKVAECYNGKSAWRMDSRGLRTLLGDEAKRLRLESILANTRLGDLKRNRIMIQSLGKQMVDGRAANAVELVKDSARVKLFFDATSNLIIKQERETTDGAEEILYGDYRKVDGVMEPFSIKIKRGAVEMNVAVERVEHNSAVDVTAFRYPQVEGARPLPELEPLMKAVIANQEKVEQMRERYTCRVSEVERKHDGDGRVKESETKVSEVTPVGDGFVERLISVNGKELSVQEREKEDRRVQKVIEELIKRQNKEREKQERARERAEEEKDNKNNIRIIDFLRISEITSIRREMFRGHEVIAFDFEPRKGFKPKSRAESIVSKLAGTVWVDESALQIARLEARLTDSFKIGGGLLASVGPSTAFVFEQEKISNEVWLPSYAEANISARVMLFAKINRSMTRQYSDYKKYKIDSAYEVEKPKDSKP